MRKLAALAALVALSACGASPVQTETGSNGFVAELIGTVDGCRIWRIKDAHTAYFARCEGEATTVTTEVKQVCGKGCVRTVPIQFMAVEPQPRRSHLEQQE